MSEEKSHLLMKRIRLKRKKPDFLRQEWFRQPKLGKKWRTPRGIHSKMREHIKGRGFMPSVGYGSIRAVKNLHPCGLKEVLVNNPAEAEKINPKLECIRISGSVGIKKRIMIAKIAKEKSVRVLNPQGTEKPVKERREKKEEAKNEIKTENAPAEENAKADKKPKEKKPKKTEEKKEPGKK